jgi:hypothetical protein
MIADADVERVITKTWKPRRAMPRAGRPGSLAAEVGLTQSAVSLMFAHDATTRNWPIRAADDDPTVLALETTGVNDLVRRLSDVDV